MGYWASLDKRGHFIDIMPTLVELSGATYPRAFGDSRSWSLYA